MTASVRVLFVSESAAVWGAEESLLLLLEHAQSNGCLATCLVTRKSPLIPRLRMLGIPVIEHAFAKPAADHLGKAGLFVVGRELLSVLVATVRLLPDFRRQDVIVGFSAWQCGAAALAGLLRRQRFVFDLHETFESRVSRTMIRLIYGLSSVVVAPSRSVLIRSGLGASKRVEVVRRPVPLAQESPGKHPAFSPARGPLVVGIFGQVVPHKRVLDLVEVIGRVQAHAAVVLLVVGASAAQSLTGYEREVREALVRLGPGSRFVERVADPLELMSSCHVVVNCSQHEAFGRTVVEAVRAGSFPVVTDGTGTAEVLRELGIGLVAADFEELEDWLASVALGRSELSVPDQVTRERALAVYEPQAVAERYFGVITNRGTPR